MVFEIRYVMVGCLNFCKSAYLLLGLVWEKVTCFFLRTGFLGRGGGLVFSYRLSLISIEQSLACCLVW